ncbi:hypothetical protein KSP39_PZI024500 [Platanthera zijinensis]|uniref:RHOMBOID-like protein n=1 Tax=Platanthera zijinensis TaxID=2320716 RepID=A0AAP0ATI8_9ASPA
MGKQGGGSAAVDVVESRAMWVPYHYQQAPPTPAPPNLLWASWLVPAFVIANIAVFAYSMYANNCPARHPPGHVCVFFSYIGRYSFEPISVNPLLGPASETLDAMGALDYNKIVSGEAWRLITCIWLHGGVIHLLPNMLSLLFIGVRLEEEFGFVKIGTLYIISGIGGSLMSSLSIRRKNLSWSIWGAFWTVGSYAF